VLTKAEYASIDFHDARRSNSEFATGFTTETAALLLMVLARIGIRIPETPAQNPNDSHFDLMIIRGHVRTMFGVKHGPQHREDFNYT